MSKIEHIGNGVFVDLDPVDSPDGAADPDVRIYAYAEFRSLEHVSFGLARTGSSGFRTRTKGKESFNDYEEVGEYGMEPLNPFMYFDDAMEDVRRGSKFAFEEVPFVEIESEEQYEEALDALDVEGHPWEGPGLYDFRDSPPSFAGTVEDSELEAMEYAADDALDFMFQSDEWEEAYARLAEEEDE
jgi:hypothetical protein